MKKVSLSFVGSLFTLGVASILTGCAPSNPNMADRYADANDFGGSNLRFDSNTTSVYENINENSGELKSEDLNTDTVSDAMSAFLNNETSSMAVPQAQSARVSLAAVIQDDPAQTTTGDQAADEEEAVTETTPTEAGESTDVEAAVDQTTSARDYFVSYADPAVINSRQFTVERDENNRAIGLTISNGSNTATYMFDNRLETNDGHVLIVSNEDLVAHADRSLTQRPTITVLRFAEGQNGNTNLNYRIEGELRVFAAQSLTDVMVDVRRGTAEQLFEAVENVLFGNVEESVLADLMAIDSELTEDPVNASAGALESRFLLNFGPVPTNIDVVAANCESQQGPSSQLLCEFNGAEDKDAYVTMAQAVWLSSSVDTVVQDKIEAEVNNENFNIHSHLDYRGEVTAQLTYGDNAPIEISHSSVHQPASEEGVSAVEATRDHFRSSVDMDNIDSYVTMSAVTNDDDSNDPNVTLVQKDISNNNLLLTFRFPADTGDGHVDLTLSRIQFVAPASEDEATDETAEPVADESAEPVTDETTEPVAGETAEPVTDETTEPVAGETAEPVADETTEPTNEPQA